MEELRAADVDYKKTLSTVENGSIVDKEVAKRKAMNDANPISTVNRVWGGDKRLSLYGYTLETINLLLLPMMQSKYVAFIFWTVKIVINKRRHVYIFTSYTIDILIIHILCYI